MARYDFGLRGPRDTQDPRYHDWSRGSRSESEHPQRLAGEQEAREHGGRDYTRPTGDRYPRGSYREGMDLSGRTSHDGGSPHRDTPRS